MKKDKYIYPAIFEAEGEQYNISFPDLDIFTCGDNLEDALYMAKDLLGGYLYTLDVFVNPKVHHLSIEKYTTLSKKNYCSFSHFSVSLNR